MQLRSLGPADEVESRAAHAELAAEGFSFLPCYDPSEPWPDYLSRVEHLRDGDALADPPLVLWTDRYGVVDDVVVASLSVRHRLTDGLARTGGHIGYVVRPQHRRRGYATTLLLHGLAIARELGIKEALVTCRDDNLASATVIERCAGVLDGVVVGPDGIPTRRYRVSTHGAAAPTR